MTLVDTHTHVYMDDYDADRAEVMARAAEAGVGLMVLPCVNLDSLPRMQATHEQWPEVTRLAIGLHPTDVDATAEAQLDAMEAMLDADPARFVAVGEVGIDLHWDTTTLAAQQAAFSRQLHWALRHGLPVIIHSRDALEPTLEVLAALPSVPELVFHSFGGTADDVARIRQVAPRAYFGLNGVATFKNCHVRDAVPAIGLDRLVLETDSPWLAPVPHRGKRCEPAMTAITAAHLATHLNIPLADLAAATTRNALSLMHNA